MEAIEAMPIFAQAKPAAVGQAAAEACAAKAERTTAFDAGRARAAVLEVLADGQARSGEQLVDHCLRLGIVPHDARAFGAVFAGLAKNNKIVSVGFAARRKGHGTAGARLWRVAK
jgi:hypothetical protein